MNIYFGWRPTVSSVMEMSRETKETTKYIILEKKRVQLNRQLRSTFFDQNQNPNLLQDQTMKKYNNTT